MPPRLSTQEGPKQEKRRDEEQDELSRFAKRFSDTWVTQFPHSKPMSVYVGSQEIEKRVEKVEEAKGPGAVYAFPGFKSSA